MLDLKVNRTQRQGRATVQTGSRLSLTVSAEAWFQTQIGPYRICIVQSDTGTHFSPRTAV